MMIPRDFWEEEKNWILAFLIVTLGSFAWGYTDGREDLNPEVLSRLYTSHCEFQDCWRCEETPRP